MNDDFAIPGRLNLWIAAGQAMVLLALLAAAGFVVQKLLALKSAAFIEQKLKAQGEEQVACEHLLALRVRALFLPRGPSPAS